MKKSIISIAVNQSWRMAGRESRKAPNKRNSRVKIRAKLKLLTTGTLRTGLRGHSAA